MLHAHTKSSELRGGSDQLHFLRSPSADKRRLPLMVQTLELTGSGWSAPDRHLAKRTFAGERSKVISESPLQGCQAGVF